MGMESANGQTREDTRACGMMARKMERASSLVSMVRSSKELGKTAKS